jgi:hypothetical protein
MLAPALPLLFLLLPLLSEPSLFSTLLPDKRRLDGVLLRLPLVFPRSAPLAPLKQAEIQFPIFMSHAPRHFRLRIGARDDARGGTPMHHV